MSSTSPAPVTAEQDRARSGRRWLWAAVLVLIGWLSLGSVLGPAAGQISSAQENDSATFLPASAESTIVNNRLGDFIGNIPLPVTVLFTADGQVTPDQLAAVTAWSQTLPALEVGDGKTLDDFLSSPPQVIPSQDGEAVQVSVNIDSDKASDALSDGTSPVLAIVEAIRDADDDIPGLTAYVTGGGGILADLIEVFGEIDGTLLLAALLAVTVILIFVYRSPFLWVIPLTSSLFALTTASAIVYWLAKADVVTLNGQSQGILTVLVFGAGTDYALLTVSRYREELHKHESPVDAMRVAWRGTVEPILASAGTASLGLLMLLFSELNSNKSSGPIAAIGIASALVVMLTFLPALLVVPSVALPLGAFLVVFIPGVLLGLIFDTPLQPFALAGAVLAVLTLLLAVVGWIIRGVKGDQAPRLLRVPAARWAFWPKIPRHDDVDEKLSGRWATVARTVGRRPRATWMFTAGALVVVALFSTTLKTDGIETTEAFADQSVESVVGQEEYAKHFPAGGGDNTWIIAPADDLDTALALVAGTDGVAQVVPFTGDFGPPDPDAPAPQPVVVDGEVLLVATLENAATSLEAEETVIELRAALDQISGDVLVGGQTAVNIDTQEASQRDNRVVIPLVLGVIFLILVLLLRSLVAPILLVTTVVLSFFTALGVSAIFFNHVFQFPGGDASFPLFAFVFLVALGIDYNIFLMTRVREESHHLGTRPGILKGLAVTGGVITSAGIVLAATFAVLGVLPLVFLQQIGFVVAVGVLIDTFIVRSLVVPALSYDIGGPIWWPSKLGRQPEASKEEQRAAGVPSIT